MAKRFFSSVTSTVVLCPLIVITLSVNNSNRSSKVNLKQLINSPTRISRDSKSLIDLIAVNYPQNICDSGVVSANLSDHELVSERSIGGKPPLNLRPLGTMLIIIRVISGGSLKVLPGTLFLLPMDRLLV